MIRYNSELVTLDYILQIKFYTRALVSSLMDALGHKTRLHHYLIIQDKTQYLPKDLYEALTAEPVLAPVKQIKHKKKRLNL